MRSFCMGKHATCKRCSVQAPGCRALKFGAVGTCSLKLPSADASVDMM